MKHIILILCVLTSLATHAQESILDFKTTIVVKPNRSVDVTEEITVKAEGYNIKRGIFRDVITTMVNDRGRKQLLNLEVYEVLKNGSPEKFTIERMSTSNRIRIGDADVLLDNGVYTYTIRYNLNRQVRFFDDYDEIYWNATGNDWMFQIKKATATIILPEGAVISQHAGYSGPKDATGCDCRSTSTSPNSVTYTLTSSLSPYEGLTVAAGWQKGIIIAPTAAEMESESFNDYRGIYYGVFGILVIATYLLYAWFRVGRDPAKGAIIPRYEPPDGFSPAACRYVLNMSFDRKAFTAAIVNMALKGYLVIDKSGKHYVLKRVATNTTTLSPGEKGIADSLFAGMDTITLSGSYVSSMNTAVTSLQNQLRKDFLKITFHYNFKWMIPAILMAIGVSIAVMSTVIYDGEIIIGLAVSFFMLIFALGFLVAGIAMYRQASGFTKIFFLIPAVGIPVGILIAPVYLLSDFYPHAIDLVMAIGPYVLIFLSMIILIVWFFYLIKAPTVFGRRRMDEIEGLKLFMEVADKDRLNMLNPPDKTPQLFEKLLPYAIALDVENKWSKQFESVIAQAIQNNEYHPTWYVGDSSSAFRVNAITSSLGSSFSSAVSSSSTPPSSSSSGSGGGGSSGGGGGGGGGGGW